MRFEVHSFRHGLSILQEEKNLESWKEIQDAIESITDEELSLIHGGYEKNPMSLSRAINDLLKEKFTERGWNRESAIFQEDEFQGNRWRLDFAKKPVSIEVAFNHGEAIAWNLLKPVLASELNHVEKAIQTEVGVIITATQELKDLGAFDSAVGEYEKFLRYLRPLRTVLTVPMVVIGLRAPETFVLVKKKISGKTTSIIEPRKSM